VILASHLGRPRASQSPQFSLRPSAALVSSLLGRPVRSRTTASASRRAPPSRRPARAACAARKPAVPSEEEKNDPRFAKRWRRSRTLYVDDAFGAAHRGRTRRSEASRITFRRAAGLLMEQELEYLGHVLELPERPFVAILGGAKVSDKIEVIQNLLGKVDALLIGGAMAYTFLRRAASRIGKSLVEDDKLDAARRDRTRARKARRAARAAGRSRRRRSSKRAPPRSAGRRRRRDWRSAGRRHRSGDDQRVRPALSPTRKTVVWNGPMGVFEIDAFAAAPTPSRGGRAVTARRSSAAAIRSRR
jgi:phosphoglycerate kinase